MAAACRPQASTTHSNATTTRVTPRATAALGRTAAASAMVHVHVDPVITSVAKFFAYPSKPYIDGISYFYIQTSQCEYF